MSDSLLDIGKVSLFVHRAAINTTGHNIANIDTEGYSKQLVNMESAEPLRMPHGMEGRGVTIGSTTRSHNTFLFSQLIEHLAKEGTFEESDLNLRAMADVFDEMHREGLGTAFDKFFGSIHNLSMEPYATPAREALLETSQLLTNELNRSDQGLADIRIDMESEIDSLVTEINNLAEQIVDLNQTIVNTEAGGEFNANDARDTRDQTLSKLTKLVDLQYLENDSGSITILVGGRPLVDGVLLGSIKVEKTVDNFAVVFTSNAGFDQDITNGIKQGQLYGALTVRDTTIPQFRAELDKISDEFATAFNAIHSTGFGLDGTTGLDFFVNSTSANSIAINPLILANTDLIAGAQQAPPNSGDNSNLLDLADLQFQNVITVLGVPGATVTDYLANVVRKAAEAVKTNDLNKETQNAKIVQLKTLRESSDGVALDEEMVNLIQFERGFNASARLIQTANEMIDIVLSLVR